MYSQKREIKKTPTLREIQNKINNSNDWSFSVVD